MNTKQAVEWLQMRLSTAFEKRITWSLDDRAAISHLCIDAIEQDIDQQPVCVSCDWFTDESCPWPEIEKCEKLKDV